MHLNPESLSFALLISDLGSIARAANIRIVADLDTLLTSSRVAASGEEGKGASDSRLRLVWRKAKAFRNASQVSTWIIGVAYRTAIRERRRLRARFQEARSRIS